MCVISSIKASSDDCHFSAFPFVIFFHASKEERGEGKVIFLSSSTCITFSGFPAQVSSIRRSFLKTYKYQLFAGRILMRSTPGYISTSSEGPSHLNLSVAKNSAVAIFLSISWSIFLSGTSPTIMIARSRLMISPCPFITSIIRTAYFSNTSYKSRLTSKSLFRSCFSCDRFF
ncbi:hypothetical protein D3C81_1197220 [compost metagenome]